MTEINGPSFEEAMTRLTAIVARLDGEEVGLDESVRLFREGQALAKRCEELLRAAQEEIRAPQDHVRAPGEEDEAGAGFDGELPF